jgi:hypothetical protein
MLAHSNRYTLGRTMHRRKHTYTTAQHTCIHTNIHDSNSAAQIYTYMRNIHTCTHTYEIYICVYTHTYTEIHRHVLWVITWVCDSVKHTQRNILSSTHTLQRNSAAHIYSGLDTFNSGDDSDGDSDIDQDDPSNYGVRRMRFTMIMPLSTQCQKPLTCK